MQRIIELIKIPFVNAEDYGLNRANGSLSHSNKRICPCFFNECIAKTLVCSLLRSVLSLPGEQRGHLATNLEDDR